MDWIERWFDIAPDNGDGTLEALVLVAARRTAGALQKLGRRRAG